SRRISASCACRGRRPTRSRRCAGTSTTRTETAISFDPHGGPRPGPPSPPGPPPGNTTTIEAASAIVIAPHFDDEVLGCGGLVGQLTAAGATVRVAFCSDGGGETADPERRRAESARRRVEARRAAAILGLAGIDELDFPDGALAKHVGPMAESLHRLLLQHRPELVLVPSPLEVSADHRATFAALQGALATLPDDAAPRILAYEVNHPL